MVGALVVAGDAAQETVSVLGGVHDRSLEQNGVDVMRAAEGSEHTAGAEKFEGAEMNLFVTAHGVRYGGAIASEGGRIEDDQVVARNHLLVRRDGGFGFEPVEDVRLLECASIGEPVAGGNGRGSGDGVGGLVDADHAGRSRARGVQRESSEETEAVEHLRAFREARDQLVIHLLIEIKAGLVAGHEVHGEL